eukprot:scaffold2801_cov161-Ochromonas_danica.AAC.7
MEEVEGFLGGELDYINLKGSTGPLVYPAGFLYIFAGLRSLTSAGTDIFRAQILFVVVYIVNLAVVYLIYYQSGRVAGLVGLILILSKRIHSIYMLRMFNDCIAVLLGHIAMYLFCKYHWRVGCATYSLAVSVKMNLLLYAPGLLFLLLLANGVRETILCLSICAGVQLILGAPFLLTYPISYISKAFEFGRVFTYIWTVNFKFLPEEFFVSKYLSAFLLLLTIMGYLIFARKWLVQVAAAPKRSENSKLSANFIASTLWTSNLIGVVFARSLHYQFYCWYFYSLPFLLWQTSMPFPLSVLLMGVIELSFNIFPSTWWSSLLLQLAHVVVLLAAFYSKAPMQPFVESSVDKRKLVKEN